MKLPSTYRPKLIVGCEDIPIEVEETKNPKSRLPHSTSSYLRQPTSPKGTNTNEIISLSEISSPIIVPKTRINDKRKWDFVTELPRPYLQVHSQEKEVLLWKSLPPKDQKRFELLNKLRNKEREQYYSKKAES